MLINKITMTITVEATDLNAIPGIVMEAAQTISGESPEGSISKSDGDCVRWNSFVSSVNI